MKAANSPLFQALMTPHPGAADVPRPPKSVKKHIVSEVSSIWSNTLQLRVSNMSDPPQCGLMAQHSTIKHSLME